MDVTNLNEGMIAAALAVIAVSAVVSAYFSWRQGRQQVVIEAFETIKGDQHGALVLTLAVAFSNRRRSSIQPLFLEIRGLPKADVTCTEAAPVEARLEPNRAPFPDMPILPFEAREATFHIAFDWQAARLAAPAGGGDLRWQAVVTCSDRHRRGRRWSHELQLAFQGEELHRLTASASPAIERRGPRRPFSGPAARQQS